LNETFPHIHTHSLSFLVLSFLFLSFWHSWYDIWRTIDKFGEFGPAIQCSQNVAFCIWFVLFHFCSHFDFVW
jgi:hypothetical protein